MVMECGIRLFHMFNLSYLFLCTTFSFSFNFSVYLSDMFCFPSFSLGRQRQHTEGTTQKRKKEGVTTREGKGSADNSAEQRTQVRSSVFHNAGGSQLQGSRYVPEVRLLHHRLSLSSQTTESERKLARHSFTTRELFFGKTAKTMTPGIGESMSLQHHFKVKALQNKAPCTSPDFPNSAINFKG